MLRVTFVHCGCLLAVCLVSQVARAENWPAFRGPAGNGRGPSEAYPTEWSVENNIRWRVSLPAPGNSSPIVWGDHVYITCADAAGHERTLYCFDRGQGGLIWKQTIPYDKSEETHKTNPFCPSTPVADAEHVYVWHGSAGMHAYTHAGERVWTRDLGEFRHIWGLGSSPILYRDLLIQLCGPGERTFVVALDKLSGETRWETPVEPGGSASDTGRYVGTWVTPVVATVHQQDELLCTLHDRLVSLSPASGKEMWSVAGTNSDRADVVYTSPMTGEGPLAIIMCGYGGPEFAVQLDGQGEERRVWHHEKDPRGAYHPQRIGTGVVVGDHLFMANADDAGSLECVELATGKRTWQERRTADGPHWGSMILAGGSLYVTGQNGVTRVLKPNPDKFESVAENDLGEQSNSTPAFADGAIYLRTFDALYCISNSK